MRLYGIDTPEKGQPYGRKAKQFVLDIAAQKIVTVEVKDTDRYGRIVGEEILPGGRNLNRELVRNGYAWWYRKYSDDDSLGELEAEARKAGKGLWKDPPILSLLGSGGMVRNRLENLIPNGWIFYFFRPLNNCKDLSW